MSVYLNPLDYINFRGLKAALRGYEENGKNYCTKYWRIHDGHYDEWWCIEYIEPITGYQLNVATCLAGKLENNYLAPGLFKRLLDVVAETYPTGLSRMQPSRPGKLYLSDYLDWSIGKTQTAKEVEIVIDTISERYFIPNDEELAVKIGKHKYYLKKGERA